MWKQRAKQIVYVLETVLGAEKLPDIHRQVQFFYGSFTTWLFVCLFIYVLLHT